jgi:hypothetical protein
VHNRDDLAAAWSKLEAYAARFALIIQMISWAYGGLGDTPTARNCMHVLAKDCKREVTG